MRFEIVVAASEEELGHQAHALLTDVISEAQIDDPQIDIVHVRSDDDARELRCLGSPTIRVEGFDVEYAEREPPERSAGARYYSTPSGWKRLPEPGMIRFAIDEARGRTSEQAES